MKMRVWIPVPILKRVWDGYTHTDDLGLVEGGDRRIAVGCQVLALDSGRDLVTEE